MKREQITIEDEGRIGGNTQLDIVLEMLAGKTKQAVVADGVEEFTHWWLIRRKDGSLIAYFGTQESFNKNTRIKYG